jgi:PilZ domain-containing protein
MLRIPIFRRQPNLCPLPPLVPRDRRQTRRHALDFPLRLRLGAALFPGHASNLSVGGGGLRLLPGPDARSALGQALASHERGALELLLGDLRFVARVRIAHVMSSRDGLHVGVAFDNSQEAERLIRWLKAHGLPTNDTER